MRLAAQGQLGAFAHGILDMLLDLGHGLLVDQRTGGSTVFQTVANLQLAHGSDQFLGKGIVDAVLDVDAVGADAGLAVVAVLGDQRAFDGGIQVSVIENDERRVAAQLQRHLLDVLGALGHQLATDLGRAGEAQLAHDGVAGQLATHFAGAASDHAQHTFRNTGALGQLDQGQGGERRLRSRFDHHGATGGQRRAGLAGDHRGGEVPRGDGRSDTDRLLNHDQALVRLMAGDHVTVDALGFFGEPLDEGGGVSNLALGFGQRLALLQGHQATEVVLIFHQQLEPATQLVRTLLGSQRTPGRQRLLGSLDGAAGFSTAHLRNMADDLASRRVVHGNGLTAVGVQPLAIDISLLAQQLGVFQLHGSLLQFRHPGVGVSRWSHGQSPQAEIEPCGAW